jgi:hypothetical protein
MKKVLYNTCASEYLTLDVNNNTIYFETELNGLVDLSQMDVWTIVLQV